MINTLHPGVALDMYKIETKHRMAKLEQRRQLMESHEAQHADRPQVHPTRPQVHAVRRATFALAGAGLALSAVVLILF